jgi:glutamate synthase (NADPH) small chain
VGKTRGFLTYTREMPADRPPLLRIGDWEEFHSHLPDEKQIHQGARCMDCGIPFCHSGIMIRGAVSGCPLNNLIPEWNDLICHGLWREAWLRLIKTNNFPEITGRVCPAPCEGACTVGIHDPPVTIKSNECHIIDNAYAVGWMKPRPPRLRTGKQVAVIGSGPAGLACADQLNKAGHFVTVYERADRIGGLLAYGIPNMKLDKHILARRVEILAAEGIRFITGCEVGRDLPLSQLREEQDAVVLCGGATKPRDLPVEGRSLAGVHFAIEYLQANTQNLLNSLGPAGSSKTSVISAEGLDVLVVGGGDTGTDCVGTAIRQGCRSITQIEIMPCPPKERAPDNPWPSWPSIQRTDYGQEEAAALFGTDPRVYLTTVSKLAGDGDGRVAMAYTVGVQWEKDVASGRMVTREIPGTGQEKPAQLVLLAMGFLGPEDTLFAELPISRDGRSNIQTAPDGYETSQPGIFTAGDMHRGQSLVVWAIQEGRRAARACDLFLSGCSCLPG